MCTALAWRRYGTLFRSNTLLEVIVVSIVGMSLLLSVYVYKIPMWFAGNTYLVHTSSSIPFAILIFVIASESGLVSRILSSKSLVFLGEISYSMYLLHFFILTMYGSGKGFIAIIPEPLHFIAFWAILVTESTIVWKYVEKPGRRFIVSLRSP